MIFLIILSWMSDMFDEMEEEVKCFIGVFGGVAVGGETNEKITA